jgi:very-short-patch-repair endonuclease
MSSPALNLESPVKNQLEKWKKHLIDFSRRNQLLFFKPKSSTTIFLQEKPQEIFQKLVIEAKSLGFQAQINTFNASDFGEELPPGIDAGDLDFGDLADPSDSAPLPIITESFDFSNSLLTDKDSRDLEQNLSKLKTRSQASLQEQGVNILYTALYFLEWFFDEEHAKSPLLLIPVSLERKGLSGSFKLSMIDDEIRINPTLIYKLERDFGISSVLINELEEKFSNIESTEDLAQLISEFSSLLKKDHPSWEIVEEASLSLFSFAKLSLYRDIEENEEIIINHPVIKQIAGQILEESELNQNIDLKYLVTASDIDKQINPSESRQILEADSSQEEAIYAARAGASFVIQGPPGTGKSQTISNIIAEALACNKKILFVSEKKSALDVVVNRLRKSKLDHFCLELHNSQQKKSDIVENLRTTVEDIKNIALQPSREAYLDSLPLVKSQIQQAIDELHKIRRPINMSLYEIYGRLACIETELQEHHKNLEFTIPTIEAIDPKRLSEIDYLFKKIAVFAYIINNYDKFIWKNANIQNLSFDVENQIKSNFIEFKNLIGKLSSYANPISERFFGKQVNCLSEFRWLAQASELAVNSPFPKKDWFNKTNLEEVQNLTITAKVEYEEYRESKKKILSRYSEGFLELNHQEFLEKFTQKFTGIFKFLNVDYWKTINQVKKMSLFNETRSLQMIINDLQQAVLLDKQASELNKDGAELTLVLGDFYKELDTDWNETITAIRWVQKVMSKFNADVLPNALLDIISDARVDEDFEQFKLQTKDLLSAYDLLKYHIGFYNSIFPHPNINIENISFDDLIDHLDCLVSNIIQIEDWIEFKSVEKSASDLGMSQMLQAMINSPIGDLSENIIKNIFSRKLYQLWIDKIELENLDIRKFSGQGQELLINKFNSLDKQIIEKNNQEIAHSLALNWIDFASNTTNRIDMQILNQEINKKKKHKPIRLIIQEIPELLQTLKPCWMMSPLSVSQLIEANKKSGKANQVKFDLVIFDEASQIRTEDAICAIYRADQLILAGDSNQLPPTNFFNYINDDDDYENNNFESVLDECSVFLKSHTLNWHYRSRHEDLIKFSNANIYDGQLITFPSAISKSENFGVDFEFIPDGYYERGSRFNRKEAQRVAEAIMEHYESNPNLSLGVIAFSEAQQFAIERELAKILRSSADKNYEFLDEEKSDSLFIKNLENVQGDERDFIFFSIGYAYDKKGTLSHNFGPLNREGGHRRLNVAVTRARNKLKVFSSIHASDIDLNRTGAQGAILLKKYLAFAETCSNNEVQAESMGFAVDELPLSLKQKSLIEESIAKSLNNRGFKVERYLGSSDYRIDLAVCNPNNPNEFILAIETDGEMYRSAKTTRDRERLRREVLESLGWNTHRIWARDWIRNNRDELDKLINKLNQAIKSVN